MLEEGDGASRPSPAPSMSSRPALPSKPSPADKGRAIADKGRSPSASNWAGLCVSANNWAKRPTRSKGSTASTAALPRRRPAAPSVPSLPAAPDAVFRDLAARRGPSGLPAAIPAGCTSGCPDGLGESGERSLPVGVGAESASSLRLGVGEWSLPRVRRTPRSPTDSDSEPRG